MFRNFFRKLKKSDYNVRMTEEYRLYGANDIEITVLKFSGDHGIGSYGNEDSNYIYDIIREKLYGNKKETTCIIVDFENFSYSWGNSIIRVFDFNGYENIRVVFVLGNKCSEGLKGLCEAFVIDTTDLFFETVDAAMEDLSKN